VYSPGIPDMYHHSPQDDHGRDLLSWARATGLTLVAHSVLSGGGGLSPLDDPVVATLASKYRRSPAQLLIRHVLQKGLGVAFASLSGSHTLENVEVFTFEIEEADMIVLDSLVHVAAKSTGESEGRNYPAWFPDVFDARGSMEEPDEDERAQLHNQDL